jgi:hypothetical protein
VCLQNTFLAASTSHIETLVDRCSHHHPLSLCQANRGISLMQKPEATLIKLIERGTAVVTVACDLCSTPRAALGPACRQPFRVCRSCAMHHSLQLAYGATISAGLLSSQQDSVGSYISSTTKFICQPITMLRQVRTLPRS